MRQKTYFFTIVFMTLTLSSCDNFGNRQNPLYGKIFRDIKDIPELKRFTHTAGSVMDVGKTENGEYRFGIANYQDNGFNICIFEEFLKSDEQGNVKYQILDTINIGKLKNNEYFTFCNCRQDTTWDSEIIALVVADHDNEYYDRIIKAWRANTKTGEIEIIKILKGINCSNEGFGADGCGEDENFESDEKQNESTNDSLSQFIEIENTIKPDTNETNE